MPRPDTRYGHQPVLMLLMTRGIKYAQLARDHDLNYNHLANVVTGRIAASKELQRILPEVLGVPPDELFTERSLADGGYSSRIAVETAS